MPRLGMLKVSSSHYYGLDERKQDPRSKHYTDAQVGDAQVGDAEGLFNSLKRIDGSRFKESKTQEAITIPIPRLGMPKVTSSH